MRIVTKWKWVALGLSVWSGSGALGAEPVAGQSQADLLNKIDRLEQRIHDLETSKPQLPAPGAPREFDQRDIDRAVKAVQADAAGRHALGFPPGGNSGHDLDKGFFIRSDDGQFTLYPDLLIQFRGVANSRDDAKGSGSDSLESGFEIRRAKIGFYGTAFSPDLSYRFLWQSTSSNSGLTLQYAYAQYIFAHDVAGRADLAVRVGQFKNPVFKEEFTPDRSQLLVERSLANALLGGASLGNETQGISLLLAGKESPIRAELLIDDGIRSSNTDFRDSQPVTNGTTTTNVATDFGVAGRFDYKVFGRWGDADDFTGIWGRENLLVVGGGVDFSQGDNNSTWHYTVDAQYQLLKKFTLFAALYGDYIDLRNSGSGESRTDWGFQVQGGYFISPNLQAVARYSLIKFDEDFKVVGEDTFHEIAVGLNWFLGADGHFGNRAKISVDLNYLPNGTPSSPGLDYLASPNGKDEWVFRTQLQLSL